MDVSDTEFSILLWALGASVAALAVHLSQGWVRVAQRGESLRREWRALLLAAGVLAVGLISALVLGLQAQALNFPVGYRWWALAGLPVAVLLVLPVVLLAAVGLRAWAQGASAGLLALAWLGLLLGWIWAAGFRPGVVWRTELAGAAVVLLLAGLLVAQWMTHSDASQASPHRTLWRMGAATLAALALMGGLQVLALAAGLQTQAASVYAGQLSGAVLSLVAGVLVPLALVALTLDLWLRRRQQGDRRSHHGFNPVKRRKRRHKIRTL